MSETAAAQLRRILHLVPQIGDGAIHELEPLARREGVSAEALHRDLLSIANRFDDPAGFVEGVRIHLESERVSLVTSHFLRPMRITAHELAALELGLAMLRSERPATEHAAIDRARARLRQAIARLPAAGGDDGRVGAADDLHADPAAAGDQAHLSLLREARSARRPVRLLYRRAHAHAAEPRVVHPYALVASRGAWYLVAHCERGDGLRIFRLDRTEDVAMLDGSYEIPGDFSLDDVLGDGRVLRSEPADPLRVRYSARIRRWIEERHDGIAEPDGSYVVEHPLADRDWAVRHVLQYGADAEVLAPGDVREAVRERLRAIVGGVGA